MLKPLAPTSMRCALSVIFTLGVLCGPSQAQQPGFDHVLRLPPSEQTFVLAGLRRAGLLDAGQIAVAMRSVDVEQARILVGELMALAPLPDTVWQDVKTFAAECPIEVLPDVRLLLLVSQVLGGSEDFRTRAVRRIDIGHVSKAVEDRLAHCEAVEIELSGLSPKNSASQLVAAIRAFKTVEACEVAARLLAQRGCVSNEALAALEDALDRHGGPGVENSTHFRCRWIAQAVCRSFPDSLGAVKACAYLACNGDAVERADAHSILRRSSSRFKAALPYLRSCLRDCDVLDSRVGDWVATLALHPESVANCRDELASVAAHGQSHVKRLASALLVMSQRQ
jgi:hypothetical protein